MTKTCNLLDQFQGRYPGLILAYNCGSQRSTNGIFIPYQFPEKVFIYFASKGTAEIYRPPNIQLKNKNIFARMISFVEKQILILQTHLQQLKQ